MAGVAFDGVRIADADSLNPASPVAGLWENSGGAAASLETDFFYQGSNSVSEQVKTAELGVCFIPSTATYDAAVGPKVFLYKCLCTTSGILEVTDATGAKCEIGSGATAGSGQPANYYQYYIATNATYPAQGGWLIIPIDPNVYQYVDNDVGGSVATGSINYWAFVATYQASTKVENTAMDALDYVINGTGLTISGTQAGFADLAIFDEDTPANRYGVVTTKEGIYYIVGTITIGSGSVDTAFTASNDTVVFPDGRFDTGFCGLRFNLYSSANLHNLENCSFVGKGTITGSADTRPNYYITGSSGYATFDGCSFNVFRNIYLTSSVKISECIFLSGSKIVQSGSEILSCSISQDTQPSGSAFLRCDDLNLVAGNSFTFAEGHAIELYLTGTYNSVENDFLGYGASNTSASAIFNNSSGSITINVLGGTTPTIRNSLGSTTTLVINPVTTRIVVKDLSTGDYIENARVLVWVTNDDNYFYQDPVAITGSGTTATVVQTAHGLVNGDKVVISRADADVYNGAYSITYIDANSYSYTTNETIGTSPVEASASFAVLSGLTDVSGAISDTRSWSNSQAIEGWVRKSSSSPYYIQGVIADQINNESGFSTTIQLVRDE